MFAPNRTAVAFALLTLSACSATLDADKNVTRGMGPDADGFLVIGAANENSRHEVFFQSESFGVELKRADGKTTKVFLKGCSPMASQLSSPSCERDRHITEHVLQLAPGDWQVDSIFETDIHGIPARADTVRARLPPGIAIHVEPGEVVYAGDFLFYLDQEKIQGTLKNYNRDDAAASKALSDYPGLAGSFVYREPTHPLVAGP